jgi:hypothetical protein
MRYDRSPCRWMTPLTTISLCGTAPFGCSLSARGRQGRILLLIGIS